MDCDRRDALLCFGLGYTAQAFLERFSGRFGKIVATVRNPASAKVPQSERVGVELLRFDGVSQTAELQSAAREANAVLVSIAPDDLGDPVLRSFSDELAYSRRLKSIVYLSSTGVYGDHGGAWVDESSECRPVNPHNVRRLEAERGWQELGARAAVPVAILRLAAIYGPGRNAIDSVRQGKAKRVVKWGQVFNRIHVADIARVIDAAFEKRANGTFNIADDEPAPPSDPVAFAAQLLGRDPPPEIPFEQARASMSALGASFFADSKRLKNDRMKSAFDIDLKYPSYREGLSAIHRQEKSGS